MTVRLGDQRVLFDNGEGGVGIMIPFWGFTGQYLIDQVRAAGKEKPGADFIGNKEVRIIPAWQEPDNSFLYAAELVDFRTHKSHVRIDMVKAKVRAHEWRRQKRAEEMAPYDSLIACQIPGQAEAAEVERKKLREKYRVLQDQVDLCETPEQLKPIMRLFLRSKRK